MVLVISNEVYKAHAGDRERRTEVQSAFFLHFDDQNSVG